MQIISASINLSKIDKLKIVEGKNGAKYYNFDIIVNDRPDQYKNDVAITKQQTKEQRAAREKREYIGNGRTVFKKDTEGVREQPAQEISTPPSSSDDLPF